MNEDILKLKKLILNSNLVSEYGWVNNDEFLIWVNYYNIEYFLTEIADIFGFGLFDDESFKGTFAYDSICINLEEMLGGYLDCELEEIFSKEEYKH